MTITKLVKQRKNEDRYNVFVDDEFCFSANLEDIVRYSIKEGNVLKAEDLSKLIELCEGAKAYQYSLNLLSLRDYTTLELERKLTEREYSINTIITVLDKLKLYGIINDKRYVEKYISDSQRIKRVGMKKVLYNLERKGISKAELNEVTVNENLEYENAYTLAQKKLKALLGKDRQKDKVYRHLISKGYDFEVVKSVVNKLFKEDLGD